MPLASVGLRDSGSHAMRDCMRDCMLFVDYAICMLFLDYAICALGGSGDEAINESHKCLHLTPVDGSSVDFFSSEP